MNLIRSLQINNSFIHDPLIADETLQSKSTHFPFNLKLLFNCYFLKNIFYFENNKQILLKNKKQNNQNYLSHMKDCYSLMSNASFEKLKGSIIIQEHICFGLEIVLGK